MLNYFFNTFRHDSDSISLDIGSAYFYILTICVFHSTYIYSQAVQALLQMSKKIARYSLFHDKYTLALNLCTEFSRVCSISLYLQQDALFILSAFLYSLPNHNSIFSCDKITHELMSKIKSFDKRSFCIDNTQISIMNANLSGELINATENGRHLFN